MATILTDNFNSYTDGDLNGQGSWVGNTDYNVQGTTVKEGAKAISRNGTNTTSIYADGIETADGRQTCYIQRAANNDGYLDFVITWGHTSVEMFHILFFPDANGITYLDTSFKSYMAYSGGVWYCLEVEWRSSDDKCRFRIDDNAYIDWIAPSSAQGGNEEPGRILIYQEGLANGNTDYFDYFAENPYSPTTSVKRNDLTLLGIG